MSYYLVRKTKLLSSFEKTASLVTDYLVGRYGEELAGAVAGEARREYESIIPDIPYIKGMRGRSLNSFLLITAQELAVYRVMKKHGKAAQEAWEICHEAIRLRMQGFSRIKRWLLKKLMFSRLLLSRVRKRAERDEHIRFGDFEVRYVIGNGKEFDYGVDYVACGNYNFLKAQGAEEFAPYVCMSDIALGEALGWGLVRTQTIADGCEFCDFRFKKGSETKISSKTPDVQGTIEKIREKETG